MRTSARVSLNRMAFVLALTLGLSAPMAAAQEEPPPPEETPDRGPVYQAPTSAGDAAELGEPVLEDPLIGPGIVSASACPTLRNVRQFSGEGYLLKVTGNCTDEATTAIVGSPLERLTVRDGEIRLELRVISGLDRARFLVWARRSPDGNASYVLAIEPNRGAVQLFRSSPGRSTILAERGDQASALASNDWNRLALRMQGPNLWVFLNDEPVLSAVDSTLDTGGAAVSLRRVGNVDDDSEAAVVVRNLRVSRLAGGDEARAPLYRTPPRVAEPILEDPLTVFGPVTSGTCATGRNNTQFVVDGYRLRVSGRCTETDTGASISSRLERLTVPDGDVRVEMRVISGLDRVQFGLAIRSKANPGDGSYSVRVEPGRGSARVLKWVDGQSTVLASRTDLAGLLAPDAWNSLAVRMQGPNLWVLLNDQAILWAVDSTYDKGEVWISVFRLGDLNDDQEVAVVVRNLRVSRLAE